MTAVHILPALPLAAVAAGLVYIAAVRFPRLKWAALFLYSLSSPVLAFLVYRLREHHVGPGRFCFWRFDATPSAMSFLLPLAVISPLLLWAVERRGAAGRRENASSALACFGFAAVFAAAMSDHFFLLAASLALASWCAMGAAVMKGRKAGLLLPYLFPMALADLCMALGVVLLYLSDPARGLFYPASPLEPSGMLAGSCALMLAAALVRLGGFPLHRWMSGVSAGGKDLRLLHLLGVNLTLGVFVLFAVTRIFFAWGGTWVWVCLGIGALTLVEVARELIHASGREVAWGLMCAALGASIAVVAAGGGQAASAAARLGLWAGVPALALVELGSEGGEEMGWAKVTGGASLLGLPPLAGFVWLWMGFRSLAEGFSAGETAVFVAAIPVLLAAYLVMGTTALLLPREAGGKTHSRTAAASAALLAACCAAVGLYPGAMVDLLMREYGLPLDIPFASWTTLGWAALVGCGLAVVVAYAWTRRGREETGARGRPVRVLPLVAGSRPFPCPLAETRWVRAVALLAGLLAYLAWIAAMVYLGMK